MKNINKVAIIVQARLNSQRLPKKMLKQFCESNLFEILLTKLKNSKIINEKNVYLSVHEEELIEASKKFNFNIYPRSKKSANEDNDIKVIYEWYNKLPYEYCVLISACNPLLKIETIDNFISNYLKSEKEGAFAVFEKKTYYWNQEGKAITDWGSQKIMNTKEVTPIYEAAHCLYGSRLSFLENEFWMDNKTPPEPMLFVMDEIEAFDIDYPWQFEIAKKLYEDQKK